MAAEAGIHLVNRRMEDGMLEDFLFLELQTAVRLRGWDGLPPARE